MKLNEILSSVVLTTLFFVLLGDLFQTDTIEVTKLKLTQNKENSLNAKIVKIDKNKSKQK